MEPFKIPLIDSGITLTEIPNQVSMFFEIGNCSTHCEGCHSQELWDTNPCKDMVSPEEILQRIGLYSGYITAVLFMGGQRNHIDFEQFVEQVIGPSSKVMPVGIYMGDWEKNDLLLAFRYCRWIKLGKYERDLGGLDKKETNQRFIEVQNYKFWR